MQKIPKEMAQRVCPAPSPGPPSLPMALNGAYPVHPESGGPSLTNSADTITQNATKVVQNDIILKCGNGISSAPT